MLCIIGSGSTSIEDYTSSYHSAYDLTRVSHDEGYHSGIVEFYNPYEGVGYHYCYYVTDVGEFIFMDAVTSKIQTYTEAKNRFEGVEIGYTRFYYYYPHTSYQGVGFAPSNMNFVGNL